MFQIYNEAIYDLLDFDETVTASEADTDRSDPFKIPLSQVDNTSYRSRRPPVQRLQAQGGALKLRMNAQEQFIIENLSVYEALSAADAIKMYGQGVQNKIVSSHKLNHASSRSHIIFSL